ncbi:hypothetical protein [Levilactobacillus tujiorum]|uniref:Uncharacterized protein n=1 Tax=Levilactobacillus tujiorum TaxID=2912243 RepID=A0ABX1L5Y1_9LACO|nr:hypothetical protein [Levilactobacillus tujiorum]MCH5464727.1 hypothetical protein [Levilactobacillus tujiorum]NLR11793.1 hypothetical protein [Lactobacillus sp. HBUAS51387]NLR29706.1 hypothetical protein [Levilactobacillus tujiorum]
MPVLNLVMSLSLVLNILLGLAVIALLIVFVLWLRDRHRKSPQVTTKTLLYYAGLLVIFIVAKLVMH